jgi:small-conductance mechanosensitive channel
MPHLQIFDMEISKYLQEFQCLSQALPISVGGSLLLVILAFAVRAIIGRAIRQNDRLSHEVRRRWLVTLRNGTFLVLILGLTVIWAEELRVAAVSMIAVAAATVIATKELITCLSGSVLKTVSRGFSIGDRIEIDNFRGDVIDHNALTTTILEIGPHNLTQQHTGRAIVLPNCIFLNKAVVNETYTDDYVLHVFTVPIAMDCYWQDAESELLDAANELCHSFLNDARLHFQKLGKEQGIKTLSVEPRVTVIIPQAGTMELVVRIVVPARNKGRIEQAILRRFVSAFVARTTATQSCQSDDNSAQAA